MANDLDTIERMARAHWLGSDPGPAPYQFEQLSESMRMALSDTMVTALRELRDNPPVQLMGSMTRDFALCISAILAEHEAAQL